ncbi:hydrolase [Bacillus fonticola]|uniref:hydrolase n=1 Tax=Bacillus fonticola TaxID=2728853 RepID=UPI001476732D|nr:hydrolase [Bacillus fonticola]
MLENEKKTYYINLGNGEISRSGTSSEWNFTVEATDDEIVKLRECFDSMHSSNWQSFLRAHVPYVQYHYDRENDAYDRTLMEVYQMVHELGDDSAKQWVEQSGMLNPHRNPGP